MKSLVLQWIKHRADIKQLASLTPAQFKYINKLESQGKIEQYCHLIGQQGHMMICNVDSDDELSRIKSEDPLFFESERIIYPVTTKEVHEKRLVELLRRK